MFEIKKEIVNDAGNAIKSTVINYINSSAEEVIDNLSKTYSALAKSDTLQYKIRGQDIFVRYVFENKILIDAKTAVVQANNLIKANIAEANNYIDLLNKAAKISDKKNFRVHNSSIKHVNSSNYLFGVTADVKTDKNKIVIK